MGMKRSHYIIIGANLGYENYESGKLIPQDEYQDNKKPGELVHLTDGNNGKYFIVGEIIKADINAYDGLDYNEFSMTQDTEVYHAKERVSNHIQTLYGLRVEPMLIIVTHWH
jgi:hypothetical protein